MQSYITNPTAHTEDQETAPTIQSRMFNTREWPIKNEALEALDKLGLEEMAWRITTRDSEAPIQEQLTQGNVYVLLHGWTGNNEIWNIPGEGGTSFTEKILSQDPKAVIIAVDGNGFGGSKFKDEVVADLPTLQTFCTPESYASQVDWLLSDALELDDETISRTVVAGHSMGAAAATILALKDEKYKSIVSLAPALLPRKENLKTALAVRDKTEVKLTSYGLINAALVYEIITTSLQTGTRIEEIVRSLPVSEETAEYLAQGVKSITNTVISKVALPVLIGKLGLDKEEEAVARQGLYAIHQQEVQEKPRLTIAAMKALKDGYDLQGITLSQLETLASMPLITAESDLLVPTADAQVFIATAAATYAGENEPEEQGMEMGRVKGIFSKIGSRLNVLTTRTSEAQQGSANTRVVPGGHYAVMQGDVPNELVFLMGRQ
jgi:pimeloyl-ACP methyl ester carboxylesterase